MTRGKLWVRSLAGLLTTVAFFASGCGGEPAPASSYFDERISPVLEFGCVEQTAGCHIASDVGDATGNLDLTSYDALMLRDDLLPAYGPYPVGGLLLKGGPDVPLTVETFDPPDPSRPDERFVTFDSDIRHNAGATIALDSGNYGQLKQWIEAGYTRTGVPPEELVENQGECREALGSAPHYNPESLPGDAASFDRFKSEVQPIIQERCAGSSCHGSPISDLYYACDDTEDQKKWNYFISVDHLTRPASTSGLLRRPLSQLRGGTYHEGGHVFGSTDDEDYQVIRAWAEDLVERTPEALQYPDPDEGLRYFANRVQPVMVRKGCMFLNCHSLAMFHDLRLRGGSQGFFSRVATVRNYEISRHLLALESPDPADSRLIAKNLYAPTSVPGAEGIVHRGGPLIEDFGTNDTGLNTATPDDCDGFDLDNGPLDEVPSYCIFLRWFEIERQEALDSGEVDPDVLSGLVWVARPTGTGDLLDFDTFRGGADLRMADASLDAVGAISIGASRSVLAGCGLSGDVDVRGTAVSWDGGRVAFGARTSAGEPLRLYEMSSDGSGCAPIDGLRASSDMENGILIHDFDPAYAPDGRLVFASTRGNTMGDFPYSGPTRTPASMQPNSNLYVFEDGAVRQLTFLLNQEVSPSFMADGRLIMTTEKREPDFRQLAGRRQNLDGGDYHPLFAQRSSVGFESATEIVELPNRNFALVAAPLDAVDGAGTIVLVNRSIGPDQDDRDPDDRFYIPSMAFPAPGAFGGMQGVYRSPAPLPSGRFLASCDVDATSMTSGGYAFQICEIDPATDSVRVVGGEAGLANVEAVGIYARANHGVFVSRIDEANGHTEVIPGELDAQVLVADLPLIGTLLFSNTRIGRPISPDVGGFNAFEDLPPPPGATTFADVSGEVISDDFGEMYLRRELLGWAPIRSDGSVRFSYPGGAALVLGITDAAGEPLQFPEGAPFSGDMVQREQMQFYPGERANQSLQRRFFNGLCGGCHGSLSGRELDVAVNVDVLTSASRTLAYDDEPIVMTR